MQQPGEKGLLFEHDLAAEKDRPGKTFPDGRRQRQDLLDHVGAHGPMGLGVVAMVPHDFHIGAQIVGHVGLELGQFRRASQYRRVHHADLHEHVVFHVLAEKPQHGKQGMDAQPVEAADEHDRRGSLEIRLRRRGGIFGNGRSVGVLGIDDRPQHIELFDARAHLPVVPVDGHGRGRQQASDEQGHPAALEKLHPGHHDEDEGREHQTQAVQAQPLAPMGRVPPHLPPVAHHAELGQHEGDEDIDAVEHDEQVHRAVGHDHEDQGAEAHEQDAVLGDEAVREHGEAGRQPAVNGHVGQHPGPVDEPRLGGHKQQQRLGHQGHQHEAAAERRPPAGGHGVEEHGVERLARHGPDLKEQVADDESDHGDGQGQGHVEHGALAGFFPGFAQDGQAVGHGLDAGIGAGAHAVGVQHEEQHADHAEFGMGRAHILAQPAGQGGQGRGMGAHAVADDHGVGDDKGHEHRHESHDRFLDPAQVEHDQKHHPGDGHAKTPGLPGCGQETEDRVRAAGHGQGDGEHVVDKQGTARDHAHLGRKQRAGHDVAAAPGGEQFDDLGIGGTDDENGQGRAQGHEHGQEGVLAQGQVGLGRTVAGRGQPVRAQAHPGEKGNERQFVKERLVGETDGITDDGPAQPAPRRKTRRLGHGRLPSRTAPGSDHRRAGTATRKRPQTAGQDRPQGQTRRQGSGRTDGTGQKPDTKTRADMTRPPDNRFLGNQRCSGGFPFDVCEVS